MASFQAKTGWERPRKSENKNYRSDLFLPDPELRIPKKMQKILKIKKKTIMASFQAKTCWERLRKSENKIIVSIISYLTRIREVQKSSKKIQKIKKHRYGIFSSQYRLGKVKKGRK